MRSPVTDGSHIQPIIVEPSREENYWSLVRRGGIRLSDATYVSLTGRESLEFLSRLSTNDLANLDTGQHRSTVLTTEKGKIIDLAIVICQDDGVLLVVSAGSAARVEAWLARFVIMEDISIRDVTTEYYGIEIYGPASESFLEKSLNIHLGDDYEQWQSTKVEKESITVLRDPLWNGAKYLLLSKSENEISLMTQRLGAGETGTVQFIQPDVLETFRVEQGVPAFGKEIIEDVNPLEVGLHQFVSFTKGCYIGQEVIARLDTYKKLQRRVVSVLIESSKGDLPLSLARVISFGKDVGVITSSAWSYRHGQILALGFLKSSVDATEIDVRTTAGQMFHARIVEFETSSR